MIPDLRDITLLEAIEGGWLVIYLKQRGWVSLESNPDFAQFEKQFDSQEFFIRFPLTLKYRDFALRVAEVLQILEKCERRPKLAIYQDILDIKRESLRVSFLDQDQMPIALDEMYSHECINFVRRLLVGAAVAAAADDLKKFNRKLIDDAAVDFAKSAEIVFGDRESGISTVRFPDFRPSILKIHSILPPRPVILSFLGSGLRKIVEFCEIKNPRDTDYATLCAQGVSTQLLEGFLQFMHLRFAPYGLHLGVSSPGALVRAETIVLMIPRDKFDFVVKKAAEELKEIDCAEDEIRSVVL